MEYSILYNFVYLECYILYNFVYSEYHILYNFVYLEYRILYNFVYLEYYILYNFVYFNVFVDSCVCCGDCTLMLSIGINIFLDGYVPTENLRFRDTSLTFNVSETADKEEVKKRRNYSYPDMTKKLGVYVWRCWYKVHYTKRLSNQFRSTYHIDLSPLVIVSRTTSLSYTDVHLLCTLSQPHFCLSFQGTSSWM